MYLSQKVVILVKGYRYFCEIPQRDTRHRWPIILIKLSIILKSLFKENTYLWQYAINTQKVIA